MTKSKSERWTVLRRLAVVLVVYLVARGVAAATNSLDAPFDILILNGISAAMLAFFVTERR